MTKIEQDVITDRIFYAVAKVGSLEDEEVSSLSKASTFEDLGFDSLAIQELMIELSDEFEIEISNEDLNNIKEGTIEEVKRLLEEKMNQ